MSSPPPGFESVDVARPQHGLAVPPTARERSLTLLWALSPLVLGLTSGPCFAWAAWRLRSRSLAIEAAVYGAVTVLWIALSNPNGSGSDPGALLAILLAVVASARAFTVRGRLLGSASSQTEATGLPTAMSSRADADWTPVFPAQALRQQGQTWGASLACDGRDRHELTMSMRQAIPAALSGAALIAVDLALHIHGRGLGAGIGLVLVPLITVLFARWVDGPVLYYRTWGQLHQLPLRSVTAVSAAKPRVGDRSVLLSAPGLAKPLRISLWTRGFVMPTAARDHLRGWLSAPHVQWTAEARALFGSDDGQLGAGIRDRRRRAWVVMIALSLTGVGVSFWIGHRGVPHVPIPVASGYSTFTGPDGKPLAVGRPWGQPCQPVRFTVEEHVPDWVYAQVAAVVNEARRDGIDVTLESRQFFWQPGSLYYADGQSPGSTARVPIFANDQTPPKLPNGQAEHIELGWDGRLDADGRHDDLTLPQGILWMQVLNGHPQAVRRSIRQLVAMTQGIISTSRADSGIADGNNLDRFSQADIAAMKRMSGCG